MKIGENAIQNSNAKTEGPKGWLKNGNPPGDRGLSSYVWGEGAARRNFGVHGGSSMDFNALEQP